MKGFPGQRSLWLAGAFFFLCLGLSVGGINFGNQAFGALPLPAKGQKIIRIQAEKSMILRELEKTITAYGHVHVTDGNLSVFSEQLVAYYQTLKAATSHKKPPVSVTRIRLLVAGQNVTIKNQTVTGKAETAVYSPAKQALFLTGGLIRLRGKNSRLFARKVVEYWQKPHAFVATGHVFLIMKNGDILQADRLTGIFAPVGAGAARKNKAFPDSQGGSEKLIRVLAVGQVVFQMKSEILTGDQAVYLPLAELVRVGGHVRLLDRENILTGNAGLADIKTGLAEIVAFPHEQAKGYLIPATLTSSASTSSGSGKKATL